MTAVRSLTITDTDGDEVTFAEPDPATPDFVLGVEITAHGRLSGGEVHVTKADLSDLRAFLLQVAQR